MMTFLFCSFQIICSEQIDEIVIPSLDDIGPETTTFKPIEINVNHIRPNYSIDEKLSVYNIKKIDAYIVNQYHFYTWKEYDEKLYPNYPTYNVFFSYHILFKTIYGYVFLGLFALSGILTKKMENRRSYSTVYLFNFNSILLLHFDRILIKKEK